MNIPDGAKIITDERLTPIAIVSHLYHRFIDAKATGRKALVKATMEKKEARFAQSDVVIARLQGGGRNVVDPRKAHALIKAGKLSADEFFEACTVSGEKLAETLCKADLAELLTFTPSTPSLITEFKDGVHIDPQELCCLLAQKTQRRDSIAA